MAAMPARASVPGALPGSVLRRGHGAGVDRHVLFNYSRNHLSTETQGSVKGLLFEQFARIGKALANPHRLELIDLLAQGERSVEELADEARLSVANASQHLKVLR